MKTQVFSVVLASGLAAGHFSHGSNDVHMDTFLDRHTVTHTIYPPNGMVARHNSHGSDDVHLLTFTKSAIMTTQDRDAFATHMVVHVDRHNSFTMTEARQNHHNITYVNDPLNKWRLYDFQPHAAVPTGACDEKPQKDGKKPKKDDHHCNIQMCMWDNFFKNETSKPNFRKQGDHCHNLETCHNWCSHPKSKRDSCHNGYCGDDDDWWVPIILMVLSALALLCLLALGMTALHKRRKDRRDSKTPQLGQGVAPQQTGTETVITQQGGPDDRNATPIGSGGDAGGASGGLGEKVEKSGGGPADDGKGTTGKRAEEGRGQVQFEDGGHPGSETHVETKEAKPAGQMDGAVSGWEMPGTGSMRGRRLQRMMMS